MFKPEPIQANPIVRVGGLPPKPNPPEERRRWERFKKWAASKFKWGGGLAKEFADADVNIKKAQVKETLNKAAKIAAEERQTDADTDVKKQQQIEQFNKNVDNIFADDKLPDVAKMLKLANMIEKDRELTAQVEKVKYLIETLRLTRHTEIEILSDEDKPL